MSSALGVLILVLVTFIWGTTFVVVKQTLVDIPVSLLLALRFSLGALLLAWVRPQRKDLIPGVILGVLSFAGFATQTQGLAITSASKAAFITGLSVILTPLVGALLFRNRIPLRAYLAALVCLAGLGLMTLTSVTGVNRGDLWVLGTALAYALYIVYLGRVARDHSALALASTQLWVMALLAWLWAWPDAAALRTLAPHTITAISYLAVAATALVTVLQTLGQRVVPPYLAALIFVLEPVFAALFAYWVLGETLGPLGWLGATLVVAAMVMGELKLGGGRHRSGAGKAAPDS